MAQLLDADGTPIPRRPEIPFIQWLPDGESAGRMIDRGEAVHAQAACFIASGGRYAYILRSDGMAELAAGFVVKGGEPGEMILVAEEVAPNGPEIGLAIDRLVAASIANMDNLPITETMQ